MRSLHAFPFLIIVGVASLTGCRRDEIRTYTTPKEEVPATAAAADSNLDSASASGADAMMRSTPVTTASGPGIAWTAPDHWRDGGERPMRKATFVITADDGTTAELSVTAFPGNVGGNLANVNRWRQQLGAAPVGEAELDQLVQHLHAGDFHIDVVELTSPGTPPAKRVLGAIVPHEGATWFFKLDGPDALVSREKPAFFAFLQTLRPQS